MRKSLLLLLAVSFISQLRGQCNLLPNAVPGILLVHQNTNCFNNSGVAYNPNLGLYYGVRAGNPGFPLETWTSIGTPLYNTTAGFDWRGMWWNPTTSQLEGNGYASSGIWRADLNGSGFALNTGATLFPGQNQPDAQSCGDLDVSAYQILYYFNGNIYRYNRATNAFLGSFPITGTPVALSNLNWTTCMYTGCAGMEIALLDYVNKRVYLYNKTTGAYAGMSALPGSAVTTNGFRTSWANGYIWLFNTANFTWYSYQIFSPILAETLVDFHAEKAGENDALVTWKTEAVHSITSFVVQRSTDGIEFESIATVAAKENKLSYSYTDQQVPESGQVYYRIRLVDANGEEAFTRVETLIYSQDNSPVTLVSVYPNPAQEDINICVNATHSQSLLLSISDMTGRVVWEESQEINQGQTILGANLSGLSNGTYLLLVRGNETFLSHKITLH